MIKPNTQSIHDFIKYIDSSKEFDYLVVPEVQRGLAWDVKKIKEILVDKDETSYFGTITILKKENKFLVVDGQQRLSFFVLCYNIAYGIKKETLLMTNNLLEKDEILSFKKLYGNEFKHLDLKPNSEDYESLEKNLKAHGYFLNYLEINKIHVSKTELIGKILEKTYISVAIHDDEKEKISEHEMFINMNSLGSPLQKADLVKGIFLKNQFQEKSPTSVNVEWSKFINEFNKIPQGKPKVTMDDILVRHVSFKGKDITKPGLSTYYKKEIENISISKNISDLSSTKRKINNYIINEIRSIVSYTNVFNALSVIEKSDALITDSKQIYQALNKVLLESSKIYKPFHSVVVKFDGLIEKNSADSVNKSLKFIARSFFYHSLNDKLKGNSEHVDSNVFRPRVSSLLGSNAVNLKQFGNGKIFEELFFRKNDILNRYRDIVLDSKKDLTLKMVDLATSEKNGVSKTFNWILQMFVENDKNSNEYFSFKNKYSVEHIQEDLGGDIKKNSSPWLVVPLETSLHRKMNEKIEELKKRRLVAKRLKVGVTKIKSEYYKQSSCSYTKKIGEIMESWSVNNWNCYLFKKKEIVEIMTNWLEESESFKKLLDNL